MSNKDKKENKNLEVNVNVSYGNEVNPETIYLNSSDYKGLSREENGNIYILTTDDKYFFTNDKSVDINNVKVNGEDVSQDKIWVSDSDVLSLKSLREHYNANGQDAQLTYDYFLKCLEAQKDNPELFNWSLNRLLEDERKFYDNSLTTQPIANSQAEILEKFITQKDGEIDGAICTTIHGFIMESLQEIGIPAVLSCCTYNAVHSVLVYKPDDKTYVFNNYKHSVVVKADNIKDAIKTMHKNNVTVADGYMRLFSNDKEYKEYIYSEEAAFGEEIDKQLLTQKSLFENNYSDKSKINVNINATEQGNSSQRIDYCHVMDNANHTFAIEHKNINYSEIMNQGTSFGLAYSGISRKENDGFFSDAGVAGTFSILSGRNECAKINVLTLGIQGHYTKGKEIYNNDNTSINIAGGIRGIASSALTNVDERTYDNNNIEISYTETNNGTIENKVHKPIIYSNKVNSADSSTSDLRVGLEFGTQIKHNINDNTTIFGDVTAGLMGDLATNYKNQKYTLVPATKLNTNIGLEYTTDNSTFATSLSYYNGNNSGFTQNGLEFTLDAQHKPNNNVTFGANVNAGYNQGDLNIGLFDETIDKNVNINANVYAQINQNLKLKAGYELDKSLINNRKDNRFIFGIGYSF